ncbi:MAG: PAS domain-containing protein [Deltaproteobacteria bacterium]|nr:PAS domain-containing protein [Deltaproteobacteria bacterium]
MSDRNQPPAPDGVRESEEQLRLALQAARMGIWTWDRASGRVAWSEQVERIFGLEPGTFPGTFEAYVARIHPDDTGLVLERINAALTDAPSEQPWEVSHRVVTPSGALRWVHCSGQCIRNAAGEAIGMRGAVCDVSERKGLEQQLLQSQKLESIGRLAGSVAHDFNNLLTVILSSVEAAQGPGLAKSELDEVLSAIRYAGERAAHLTRQLLTFARRQGVSAEPCSLDDVVHGMRDLIRRLIGEDVSLVVRTASQPWAVRADPHQLEQVLVNLAVNARDAMPRGGRLTIATHRLSAAEARLHPAAVKSGDCFVCLEVSDTGVGMKPEVAERAFEPFFTTKHDGSGLGLSTCYGIVSQLGGAIHVDSTPGAGTRITVLLPQQGESVAHADRTAAHRVLGKETLLLVEDEELLRHAVSRALTRLGYRVLGAGDGQAAIGIATDHPDIRVVVTDYVLPGMNGLELARALKARLPTAQVLFVSGYAAEPLTKALRSPEEFLPKPYTPDLLATRIRRLIDGPAVQR